MAIIIALCGLLADIINVNTYMMNDLRSRVVAVRLLDNNIDPYFYKWTPGDPETYLDPRDFPGRSISRVTVPPTALVIQGFFTNFSYLIQKNIWLCVQWFSLLLSLFFLSAGLKNRQNKFLVWILGLTLIAGSWLWRFHIDAGQLYIFYVMLISAAYFILKSNIKGKSFISGFILGLLASLRPNTIVFCLPFLVLKKIRILSGISTGLILNLVVSLSLWGIEPWLNYFKAMKIHEQIHLGAVKITSIPNSIVYRLKEVEGINHFDVIPRFLYSDSSLQGLLRPVMSVSSVILIIALAIIFTVYLLFLISYRKNIISTEMLLLCGITAVIISEFFIPATRFAYYDVIWIIPLGLLIIMQDRYPMKSVNIGVLFYVLGLLILAIGSNIMLFAVEGPFILFISTVYICYWCIKNTGEKKSQQCINNKSGI
jgi:hypothetical protein